MSLETRVICDACGEEVEDGVKRCEIKVGEYVEPIGGSYRVPTFRDLHLHWKCYAETLRSAIESTDR